MPGGAESRRGLSEVMPGGAESRCLGLSEVMPGGAESRLPRSEAAEEKRRQLWVKLCRGAIASDPVHGDLGSDLAYLGTEMPQQYLTGAKLSEHGDRHKAVIGANLVFGFEFLRAKYSKDASVDPREPSQAPRFPLPLERGLAVTGAPWRPK
jgi:hypothetical protein